MCIKNAGRLRVSGALLALSACVSLSGCATQIDGTQLPDVLTKAVEDATLDERAVDACRSGGAAPAAAFDSDPPAVRAIQDDAQRYEGYDFSLPGPEDGYVAVCIYEASKVPGLESGMTYLVMWETEWSGSGLLAAW